MEKLTILIVDDEAINLELISHMLGDEYNIKIAKDGQKGLELYKKHKPSIIISDINMPIMNGMEMAEKIREVDHNTKIIFTTTHSEVDYILRSSSLKLIKYIVKPLEKDVLLFSVEQAKKELTQYEVISTLTLKIDEEFTWSFKDLSLSKNGDDINLTPSERKILNYLFKNINGVKSYDDIIFELSSEFEMSTKKSLKTTITNLRKKIPENLIENVYGIGYKISL